MPSSRNYVPYILAIALTKDECKRIRIKMSMNGVGLISTAVVAAAYHGAKARLRERGMGEGGKWPRE